MHLDFATAGIPAAIKAPEKTRLAIAIMLGIIDFIFFSFWLMNKDDSCDK
jgi:hypothetical protein